MKPLISIIVPVYQEHSSVLQSLCDWILQNNFEFCQWIVVSAQDDPLPAINWPAGVVCITSERGRANQMNAGAVGAESTWLLFLHADTRLACGWAEAICELPTGKDVWGAFSPTIDASGLFYRLAESWGRWRSSVLQIPYGDQAIFIKSSLFKEIGAFDEQAGFMEELDLASRLGKRGIAPTILKLQAITSNRRWQTHGRLFYSSRNLILFALFMIGVPRRLLKNLY